MLPTSCSGDSGQFAFFEVAFDSIFFAQDNLYFWVEGERNVPDAIWGVDKEAGGYALVSHTEAVDILSAPVGGTVSLERDDVFESEEYIYSREEQWLVRSGFGAEGPEPLFEIPESGDDAMVFLVIQNEFYSTSSEGALWYAKVAPSPTEPAIIEERGRYDDDDYTGFIAADEDAVYWKAGADPSMRTSDGDPLALFRTCRIK
jgi:hypothetical protein